MDTAHIRQPSLFIPHGGGPCFFMPDPDGIWSGMAAYLGGIAGTLPGPPRAILLISSHWETEGFRFTGSARPPLLYDYHGFPPHTYALRYDVPGAPLLAGQAAELVRQAGLSGSVDKERGLDHGVFVPMKVAFPEARIPVVAMSVERHLDPAIHIAAGQALAPLRDEGVLIVGSGMSFHNMRAYGDARFAEPSRAFDRWLTETVEAEAEARDQRLIRWESASGARLSHPREEHLIPLLVAAGAARERGSRVYAEQVLHSAISGYRFG